MNTDTNAVVSGLSGSETGFYGFRIGATNIVGDGPFANSITIQASYITVSVSSDNVSFSIVPGNDNKFSSLVHDVTIKTNNPLGYDLSLSTQTDHSNLVNITDPSKIITSTTGTFTSPILSMPVNTWGYRLNNAIFGTTTTIETNVTSSQYTWAKVQPNTSPDVIIQSNSATANTTIPIYYGLNINTLQPSGTYQATVRYTGVTK